MEENQAGNPGLPPRTANVTPDAETPAQEAQTAANQVTQDQEAYNRAKAAILELGHDLQVTEQLLTHLWNRGVLLVMHPGAPKA
jgi:hypothetical protein